MGKLLIFVLVLSLMGIAVGCADNQTPQEELQQTPQPTPKESPQATEFSDGVFKAEEESFDSHGWKGVVSVTVEDGKITEVDFDEVNEDGDLKSEDEDYAERMNAQTGVTPAEAYDEFENSLIQKQNIEELDGVSGATGSFNKFKSLVDKALKQKQ